MEATQNNAVRSEFEPEGVNNLEGLLWPDTYKISDSEDEIEVLKTMVRTRSTRRAAALGLADANVQGHGAYDILKVASMVEAEAKTAKDRPLIASVIYNRLAHDPACRSRSTQRSSTRAAMPKNRSLSNADKAIQSPYNTYLHFGLPPTPIAAISEASLRAALHPATTDYLYYVVIDKQGNHAFASTLAQHQANIEQARRNGAL